MQVTAFYDMIALTELNHTEHYFMEVKIYTGRDDTQQCEDWFLWK